MLTRALLESVADTRAKGAYRLVVLVVGATLLPLAVLVDLGRDFWRMALQGRPLRLPAEAKCPEGHVVTLVGYFECQCGSVAYTHAWAACTTCGRGAGSTVACACGATVSAPPELREASP